MLNKRFGAQITKNSNGANRPTSRRPARFRCKSPGKGHQMKQVPGGDEYEVPVSLWYKHGNTWLLQAVVDEKNLPDWAANYTKSSAEKMA